MHDPWLFICYSLPPPPKSRPTQAWLRTQVRSCTSRPLTTCRLVAFLVPPVVDHGTVLVRTHGTSSTLTCSHSTSRHTRNRHSRSQEHQSAKQQLRNPTPQTHHNPLGALRSIRQTSAPRLCSSSPRCTQTCQCQALHHSSSSRPCQAGRPPQPLHGVRRQDASRWLLSQLSRIQCCTQACSSYSRGSKPGGSSYSRGGSMGWQWEDSSCSKACSWLDTSCRLVHSSCSQAYSTAWQQEDRSYSRACNSCNTLSRTRDYTFKRD